MKRCICVLLVSIVLFGSCMNRSRVANTFVQVEKALAVAPDSAMRLLKDIPAKSLSNQAMRARYALLYIDAAERAQLNENTDSLLRIAWRYYRKHPQEMQNRCRTLYYMAHSKLRQGDKPGALRLFLKAEENNDSLDNPRDRGMLYLSIGDVYRGELNFVRAYRYYREARELFLRSGDMRHRIEALLGMTACGLRMHDFEQTRRNCRLALELSDEAHYEQLAQKSLGYLAALYALSDRGSLPEEMLRRIEQSVHRDTTVTGFRTRSQIQLLRNRPDSARHYIERAERIANSEDLPMLLYTAYKADISAGRYQEATWNINKFIYYSDSLTRSSLQGSAGMIEKEYFRERSAFYDYRLQNRRTWEITIVAAALSLLGIAGYIIRQRIHLHQAKNERYMLLVREMQSEYRNLSALLERNHEQDALLRKELASRFDIVEQIGRTLYEREHSVSEQAQLVRLVRKLIDDFSENGEMLLTLERVVNIVHDDAVRKLRDDFPQMKDADVRLLCYIFGGFSPQVISLFMHDSVANVYARKSRLKSRIRTSEAPHKELFLALLG